MKILLAPDKFKGSLTAAAVAAHLAAGLRRALPGVQIDEQLAARVAERFASENETVKS